MSPSTRALWRSLIRSAKGMISALETWLSQEDQASNSTPGTQPGSSAPQPTRPLDASRKESGSGSSGATS